jgi:drug/metabolite transporter (DMT)-like permease
VSTYIYFQPILAGIFALALGADELNRTMVFAGVAVLMGVFAVSWQRP